MKIKFCGAAEGVTGSCHLVTVEVGGTMRRFLLDCGQFQGGNAVEAQNYEPFPFEPSEVDFLILSHAHIDHSGRIPLLVKRGFRGAIYCTDATADLLRVMLTDSGHIHEKEAEWKNRKGARAGQPALEPLYTVQDAEFALKSVIPARYDQLITPIPGIRFVFNDAGHILGSAIVEVFVEEGGGGDVSKLVFTGDLGMPGHPILRDPVTIRKADYLIMESTYGNRVHERSEDSVQRLAEILVSTVKRGGTVVIPAFAVGRTQELIYQLNRYFDEQKEMRSLLRDVMVYIDSPMATSATAVFRDNAQDFDEETRARILSGDDPLSFVNLRFSKTQEDSKRLNLEQKPKVIISASGMCDAGRIRHHLKHHLWEANASIVFVGYQAEGTLGRRLIDGAKTVRLFGETVTVNAQICSLEGFSGHGDREALLAWASGFEKKPQVVFLVHGETKSKEDLADSLKLATGMDAIVVRGISEFELKKEGVVSRKEALGDFGGAEGSARMRDRVGVVREQLELILYNTQLAATEKADPEWLMAVNNRLVNLEKDTMGLAAIIARDPNTDYSE